MEPGERTLRRFPPSVGILALISWYCIQRYDITGHLPLKLHIYRLAFFLLASSSALVPMTRMSEMTNAKWNTVLLVSLYRIYLVTNQLNGQCLTAYLILCSLT